MARVVIQAARLRPALLGRHQGPGDRTSCSTPRTAGLHGQALTGSSEGGLPGRRPEDDINDGPRVRRGHGMR
ncbi:MAG: hypothetical protein QOI75_1340 [Pseudonocardiales bacterium]|nr:hypothetical protein [Pseudonocardiales bacterium]